MFEELDKFRGTLCDDQCLFDVPRDAIQDFLIFLACLYGLEPSFGDLSLVLIPYRQSDVKRRPEK